MRTVAVGVSHWHTQRYLDGFRAGGAEIVGVEDPDSAIAATVAAKVGCPPFDSIEALLEETKPELALILGEPTHMAEGARAAAPRGVPMMLEKPIARHSAEVYEIADIVERASLFAAVAFPNRALAIWGAFRELAGDGRLGRLSHLAFRTINGPPRRYADWNSGWMLDPTLSGGGALHNLGIHGVDAFLRLTGADPESVRIDGVTLSRRAHGEAIEDYGVALLRAPDGTCATLEAGYVYPVLASGMTRGGDTAWRIAGSSVYLEEQGGRLTVTWPDGSSEMRTSGGGYEAFCLDTLERLRSGQAPLATVRDCARAVHLLERIYTAAPLD